MTSHMLHIPFALGIIVGWEIASNFTSDPRLALLLSLPIGFITLYTWYIAPLPDGTRYGAEGWGIPRDPSESTQSTIDEYQNGE